MNPRDPKSPKVIWQQLLLFGRKKFVPHEGRRKGGSGWRGNTTLNS
jgi:hypothetical protein